MICTYIYIYIHKYKYIYIYTYVIYIYIGMYIYVYISRPQNQVILTGQALHLHQVSIAATLRQAKPNLQEIDIPRAALSGSESLVLQETLEQWP